MLEVGDSGKTEPWIRNIRTAGLYALYDSLIQVRWLSSPVVNAVLDPLAHVRFKDGHDHAR